MNETFQQVGTYNRELVDRVAKPERIQEGEKLHSNEGVQQKYLEFQAGLNDRDIARLDSHPDGF